MTLRGGRVPAPQALRRAFSAKPTSDDFYERLGVKRSATPKEIKDAYRKLALEYHPDRNPDNEEAGKTFQRISEAYNTLSSKKDREMYDMRSQGGGGFGGSE